MMPKGMFAKEKCDFGSTLSQLFNGGIVAMRIRCNGPR